MAVLSVGVFFLYDSYVNGGEYRTTVRKCGTNQIIYAYANPKDPRVRYVRPSDPDYSPPFPSAHYFCTEQQAIDAGYTALYDSRGNYNP